jgi:hypothetical protein
MKKKGMTEEKRIKKEKERAHRFAKHSYTFGESFRTTLPSLDDYDRSPDSDRWDRLGDHHPTMSL